MPAEKKHKVIITGTGRAGTTFLVELLTELGLDTGYTPATCRQDYHEHCKAGLERDVEDPTAPYIVNNPGLCTTLPSCSRAGTDRPRLRPDSHPAAQRCRAQSRPDRRRWSCPWRPAWPQRSQRTKSGAGRGFPPAGRNAGRPRHPAFLPPLSALRARCRLYLRQTAPSAQLDRPGTV